MGYNWIFASEPPRLGWLTAYDQTKLENLQEINIDIVQDKNNDHNLSSQCCSRFKTLQNSLECSQLHKLGKRCERYWKQPIFIAS